MSSEGQNPARQIEQLSEVRMDKIYEEKVSGASTDRVELQKMLEELNPGDIIYVTDLTRITRSSQDLFSLIKQIKGKKADLKSLKDTWLDLSEDSPYSQFLITIMSGVNQLERDLIRMRQQEGIEIAKKLGKYKGRIKKYHNEHPGMNHAIELYRTGEKTVSQICKITGISKASLYRKLSEKKLEEKI